MKSKRTALSFLLYFIVIAILIVQIYPVVWLMLSSFKSSIELTTKPFSLPTVWSFANYADVFREAICCCISKTPPSSPSAVWC
ncbi:hypothetical protein HMSSN036_12070 [Paenibacillus macerans]|nr:hypothetical protein HMSSN036_12070 [Paenibacillus macerans]